ncbi:MAG: type II secretion system major pseudopilin GspG [Candidatus Omnitrophica bacterium]|nr:type II secretion system major pseudopilin GspG [Candidatus Omnitrophota bacterium]
MNKSFTLVELMLVVIIIGILGSIVVPRLAGKAEKARVAAARADVESNIPAALDMYEMDVGEYPQNLQDLIQNPGTEGWDGPYLKKLPKDPWKRDYYYKTPGDHGIDYDIASSGKDGTIGSDDDITGWQ